MSEKEVINPGWDRFDHVTFDPAVKKDNLVFISGQGAIDERGNPMAEGDLEEQTRICFEKMDKILKEAGGSLDDIVKTTDYIVPEALDDYKKTGKVRKEYLGMNGQAATGIVVPKLLIPGLLIEIEAIAVLG